MWREFLILPVRKYWRYNKNNFKSEIIRSLNHLVITYCCCWYPIMKSHVAVVIGSIGQDLREAEYLRAPTGDQLTYFIVSGGQIGRRLLL